MLSRRLTITSAMAVVAFAAICSAALRSRSEEWNRFFLLATGSAFVLAAVFATCRSRRGRAQSLAFAAFGSAYLASCIYGEFPTLRLVEAIYPYFEPPRPPAPRVDFGEGCTLGVGPGLRFRDVIGHCLIGLAIASLAGMTAPLLLLRDEPMDTPTPRRWLRPAASITGIALAIGIAIAGLTRLPGPTAAASIIITGGLLALALIAGVSGQGTRRATFLGFALFGGGYLALAFSPSAFPTAWPKLAGDQLIDAALSRLPHAVIAEIPDSADGLALSNSRIRHALDRQVTLGVRGGMTLEAFMKAVRAAAVGPDGTPIPIHIDPMGLQNADKVMTSPLTLDFDGVQLRSMLSLTLRQLNLCYYVVDGVLVVTSSDDDTRDAMATATLPLAPARLVGHCILALLAAFLGGILSNRFAAPRTDPARISPEGH